MHGLNQDFGFPFDDHDDEDESGPRKLDLRTRDGRLWRDTRNELLREFPRADALRLREAVTLSIAIARLEPQVLASNQVAIATLAKLSNRMQILRRELSSAAAKQRETANA